METFRSKMKPVLSSFFLTICLFGIISASATVFGQSTAPNRTIRNTGSCGVPIRPSGFIVHGQEFPRGDFPWIVALMHKSRPPSFFCSGTLVSSNYVISGKRELGEPAWPLWWFIDFFLAAHCIQQKESKKPLLPREVVALFGAHDLNDPYETEKIALSPSKIYIHDDWNPFNTNYDADISILEFENGKISFNERSAYIQPICLWDSPAEPPGSKGTVTGWGKSEDTTKIHENIPKKLEVEIQTNEDCFFSSDSLIQLSSKRTFCAGLQNGSGVCFGDSGSGLFVNVNGVAYLKGIVSSSLVTATKNCDVSRNAVYTDVLAFRDWINKITGLHALSSASVKEVECHFDENIWTYFNKKINCCWIESRVIDSEHAVLNAPRDDSVLGFDARSNKNVKFLPGNIGEKFPKLEGKR